MAVSSSTITIVTGRNPLVYSASSPYTLFLFQAIFIILLCQIVNLPLSKLQQPRVIAEVITGILLGPSVLGRVPNFTQTCFPEASILGLTLLANIGIILFLFIIGLEVDIGFIKKNVRVALSVGMINMAVPFGLGCAISVGMYNEYKDEARTGGGPIKFTTFMVFIAVALCITAFPVLARILTELNLIGDRVGTIVLAAGITNDLTGWILLALVVTLANALSGVNTVYILLLTAGWFLVMCYPIRLTMKFILNKFTNDLTTGEPSQLAMMMILCIVFVSSFFTDVIGVHPIFGSFMAGVIVPRDNGYVIKITEKLEDLVHIVLIPIYFALAGLSVNLGMLNRGIDWAYTIGIILLAMFGKVFGGFVAAKINRLLWRESLAVGILMSCKGIVEIVVLNVGLNAGIISQRVYSMFIVMALVTTFLTTPLALWSYPLSYREKRDKYIAGEINWDGTPRANTLTQVTNTSDDEITLNDLDIADLYEYNFSQVVVMLKKVDTMLYLMAFIKSFNFHNIKAIHLREFSSRTSDLLEASLANRHDIQVENASLEFNNSTSLLSIVKAFTDMLGTQCTIKSLLSTPRNHVFSINDQISDKNNFLITTIKLNQLDETEKPFYRQLFQDVRSHFGLLMINEKSEKLSTISEYSSDEEEKYAVTDFETTPKGLLLLHSINVVLNHNNLLSASDKLALHTAYRLVGTETTQINIFARSSSQIQGFETGIRKLFAKKSPKVNVSIHQVSEKLSAVTDAGEFTNQLFVVGNSTTEQSVLFERAVGELLDLSAAEGFHVLAVRA